MTYTRFEELPVWRAAIQLAVKVYALTERGDLRGQGNMRDQIERAAVSVSNNFAEGFERGTTQELITFLYVTRGSAAEVRSMLCLMEELPRFKNLKFEISNLKLLAEGISRQLRAWADTLQNSPIKGQRYLTERERTERVQRKFLKSPRQIVEDAKERQARTGGEAIEPNLGEAGEPVQVDGTPRAETEGNA